VTHNKEIPMHRVHPPRGDSGATFDLNPTYYTQFAQACQVMPDDVKKFIGICKWVLDYLLSVFTIPLEALLLSKWGTRTLSLYQAVQVTVLALRSAWLPSRLLFLFLLGAMLVTWWRFAEARYWEWKRKPYRFSYSPGEPVVWCAIGRFLVRRGVPRGLFTEVSVYRFWEPATGLLVGLPMLLLPITWWLGITLTLMGVALALKRHVLYLRHVEVMRDKADAEVVGRTIMDAPDETVEEVHVVRLIAPRSQPIPLRVTRPWELVPVPEGETAPPEELVPELSPVEPIRVICGGCGSRIKCPAERAGTTVSCPKCRSAIVVSAA
jgi:hypothetical protein